MAPNLKTAQKFGNVIVKFKSLGKNLIYRFPVEMKDVDKWQSKYFRKSFRPSVSYDMSDLSAVEPQAIFIGLLSPRAIEKVFVYGYPSNIWTPMTREEYIQFYQDQNKKNSNIPRKSLFEPQEADISLEEFISRIAKDNDSSYDNILNSFIWYYKRTGNLYIEKQFPETLARKIKRKLENYIKINNPE